MESLRGFEKIAPHLTDPLVLVGFGLLVVFGFLAAVLRSGKIPKLGPRLGARVVERVVYYGLVITLVFLAGAFALAFRQSARTPDVYRVRVTVLATDGTVVDDAKLVSSLGGDFRPGAGISELVVPKSLRPADGKLTLRAERGAEKGMTDVSLDEDFQPAVTLRLAKEERTLRGRVVDADGHPLSDVRVSVVEHPDETVETGDDGRFEIPAHAGDGEWVKLRAEKEGYPVLNEGRVVEDRGFELEMEEER